VNNSFVSLLKENIKKEKMQNKYLVIIKIYGVSLEKLFSEKIK